MAGDIKMVGKPHKLITIDKKILVVRNQTQLSDDSSSSTQMSTGNWERYTTVSSLLEIVGNAYLLHQND